MNEAKGSSGWSQIDLNHVINFDQLQARIFYSERMLLISID